MKKEFASCPTTIDEKELYGLAWQEFVMAIPTPLVLVTTYKDNQKTNATMQSWTTFVSENGFYCIFANIFVHEMWSTLDYALIYYIRNEVLLWIGLIK